MADAIHRTTLQQVSSVNTPDYDPGDWIINPDLSAVSGVLKKYWKIVGDTVVEMNQTEKDAVDAQELADAKTARRLALRAEGWGYVEGRYDAGKQRMFQSLYAEAKSSGKTNRAAHIESWFTWLEGCADHVKTKVDNVDAETTVAGVNAVVLNEAGMTAGDPGTTLASILAITN